MLDEAMPYLRNRYLPKAVVVAHPDDETLWCGGLMLRYPGNWTVICCSIPTKDPIRSWSFYEACKTLGVVGRVFPFIESLKKPLEQLTSISLQGFSLVVTHNEIGEYGHAHHRQVNQYVTETFKGPIIKFGYGRDRKPDDLDVELTDGEWAKKLDALRRYEHLMLWNGGYIPTWKALLDNFGTPGKHFAYDLKREYFGD